MMQHGYYTQQQQQQQQQPMMPMQQQQQQQQHHMMSNNMNNQENGYFKRNSDLKTLTVPADSIPEAKKARYEMNQASNQQQPTNKVVSLRHIPNDITDLQIVLIGLQFGDVVNILYIKGKGQALIDFSSLNEAIDMVQYFHHLLSSDPMTSTMSGSHLKGIEAAHSSYQQLTIDNNRAAATINTIQQAKQLKEAAMTGGDGCCIKAIITNVVFPISIDALYQVFSKHGSVLKIILTQKNDLGALIQMKDEIQAQQAIINLHNRNMYNTYTGGCNILNLQPSRHKSIDVKINNNKSWDYTNPLLPNMDQATIQQQQQLQQRANGNNFDMDTRNANQKTNMIAEHPLLPIPMNNNNNNNNNNNSNNSNNNNNFQNNSNSPFLNQQHHQSSQHQHQLQQMMNNSSLTGQQQQQQQQQAMLPNGPNSYMNSAVVAAAAAAAAGYPMQHQQLDNRPAVLQVSNFPDQIANSDALFTLFGVYGDILKVKIMYNRRDNALLQFKSYDQAYNAVTKLDKVKLFDKILSVGMSKFPEIQIPIKNDGGLAKDYSNSPLHRFKKPGSKNFFNIFAPNSTLHLSNISQNTSQDQVQELFQKYGNITLFKWISKEGNKMAIIELSSLEEAVMALIALHNYQLNGTYLRVNFAK